MGKNYDYIIDIDGWSGISRLAGRDLIFSGQPYSGMITTPTQAITKGSDSSVRAPATIAVSNHFIKSINARFSDAFKTDKIEGKRLTIREVERPITALSVARTVYIGVVLYTQFDEMQCQLICVEESLSLSKRIDKAVDTVSFPRAKPESVSASVPVPFGAKHIDAILPVIEYNESIGLIQDLNEIDLAFPLETIEGLSIGAAYIGKEEIAITSFAAGPVVNCTRAKPTEHPSGEQVFNKAQFALGIDASDYLSGTTIENIRETDGDQQFPMSDPDSYGLIGSVRAAIWDETPIIDVKSGDKTSVGIEFNALAAGNLNPAIDQGNAAARIPGYQEKSFCAIAGVGNNELKLTNTRHIRPRGRITKVLASIVHSAELPGSSLGPATFFIKSNSMGGFSNVAGLVAVDQLDPEFIELGEQKGRRAIEVPVPAAAQTVTALPDAFTVQPGLGSPTNLNFDPANPIANVHDGNFGSFGDLTSLQPGSGEATFDFGFSAVPAGLNPLATINSIRFKFRHGGINELTGRTGQITLFRSGIAVAGPGAFPSTAAQQDETATFNPAETVAALPLYVGRIQLGNLLTIARWQCFEGWFELDITDPTPTEDAGAIINQFDISSIIPSLDWEELQAFEISIQGDGINQYKVFHTGLQIIYEPTELRLPEAIACDVLPALNGNPFEIIKLLWEDAAFGGNPASTFVPQDAPTIAAINSFLTVTHTFSGDNVNGLIRDTELIAFIQELVRQTRLFAFVFDTVLHIEIQDDIANLPAAIDILTKDNILNKPSFQSSDLEQQLVNFIDGDYAFTDLNSFTQSIELSDLVSVITYGEQRRKLSFPFLHAVSAIASAVAGIFNRSALPYLQSTFSISLDDRSKVNPLIRIALNLDWISIQLFEIEEISEAWNHTVQIRGRVLIE